MNRLLPGFFNFLRKNPALVGIIGVSIALSIITDSFLSVYNIINVFRQTSIMAIIGFGMTMVIISGGIDLSVGSVLALSAGISASILSGGNVFLGILAAIG